MEKPSVAFDSLPSGHPLQGKMALAAHPPSCHPQRMFDSRESERKGKKMGEKEKTGKLEKKRAESFALILFVKSSQQCLSWGPYSQNPLQITKKTKLKANTRDEFGRISKREQKVKTGSRKSNANSGSGRMVNSATGSQFCSCSNFLVFSSLLSF